MTFYKSGRQVEVLTDKILVLFLLIWLLMVVLSLLLLIGFYSKLPPVVPLLFSRNWGEPRLVAKSMLWVIPASTFLLGAFNFGFAFKYQQEEIFLSRVLGGISSVLAILLLLSVFNVVALML